MKCNCGFEEIPSKWVTNEILYKSGKKKGQVKNIKKNQIEGSYMDKASITLQFPVKMGQFDVKICPSCKLMYFDDYIPNHYDYY